MAAGDKHSKNQPPTAKRKRQAKKKGQVARSPEIVAWLGLMLASFVIPILFKSALARIMGVISSASGVMGHPTPNGAMKILEIGLAAFIGMALPIAASMMILGILINVAQIGFVFSTKGLKPDLKRLSPKAGFKKLVSIRSVWETAKQFSKIVLIAGSAYQVVSGFVHQVIGARPVGLGPLLGFTVHMLLSMIRFVALTGIIIAIGDYIFQRRQVNQSLKMSKQEIKDEIRQTEGDAFTKGRIRRQQYKLSRLRMMAEIARADVVITNPTHFAVALRYDKANHEAPIVVAKGAGEIALQIREEAIAQGVTVVEDPPLARAIFSACKLGDVIPKELFVAVARLLAFVYSLSPDARLLGVIHRRPISAMSL